MNDTYFDEYYKKLRLNTKIYGIWDDNDYGVNDGEYDNPIKVFQKKRFLQYIDDNSERGKRPDERGIEIDYYIAEHDIRLILPDLRYYKKDNELLGQ
jgi:hypothetical protein